MIIFPAIDLHHGCAVRLLRGDYNQMTEYSASPEDVAAKFAAAGAGFLHVVDLEGAKTGTPVNLNSVAKIIRVSGLRVSLEAESALWRFFKAVWRPAYPV